MDKIIEKSLKMTTQEILDIKQKKVKQDEIREKQQDSDESYSENEDQQINDDDDIIEKDGEKSSVHSKSIDIEEYKKFLNENPDFGNKTDNEQDDDNQDLDQQDDDDYDDDDYDDDQEDDEKEDEDEHQQHQSLYQKDQ